MADPQTVDQSSEDRLLRQFQKRLIDKVPFTTSNCIFTDSEIPKIYPSDPFCTVSPGDCQFDPGMWEGGGVNQMVQNGVVYITMFVRCQLDMPPKMGEIMLHPARGLLQSYKPKLLKAILVDDASWDCTCGMQPWIPVDADGYALLRQPPRPISCTSPRYVTPETENGIPFLAFTLVFETQFDWAL